MFYYGYKTVEKCCRCQEIISSTTYEKMSAFSHTVNFQVPPKTFDSCPKRNECLLLIRYVSFPGTDVLVDMKLHY